MSERHDSGMHALPTDEELVAIRELHERARDRAVRKCEPPREPLTPSQIRAKRVYRWCVEQFESVSAAARHEGVTPSAVELRLDHPKKNPPLSAAFSMPPRLKRRIAAELLESADEDERSARRAG